MQNIGVVKTGIISYLGMSVNNYVNLLKKVNREFQKNPNTV